MTWKKIKKSVKDYIKEKREIDDIKRKAYKEEMRKQALIMGRRQAELEAKHREDIFKERLDRLKIEKRKPNNSQIDPFGFNRTKNKGNQKQFNVWGGNWR